MNDDKCECGEESTKACHGFKDGEIYDEYYCDECYHKRKALGYKDE